jgi:chromate transporter
LSSAAGRPAPGAAGEVFWAFLRLGLTSFGGPVAHLGYFREAFVVRRRWLGDSAFADLVALSQFLPGPASSQVGMALGAMRAGIPGGIAAWAGFTLPSALAMIAFALGVAALGEAADAGLLHGLKVVSVAVVAQAVWGMARSMASDRPRATLALFTAALVLLLPSTFSQLAGMALGASLGTLLLRGESPARPAHYGRPIGYRTGLACLVLFAALLACLPLLARLSGSPLAAQVDSFYRSGSLIFGGGHVVLPLLQASLVPPGWIGNDDFLAGYGAAQAVPGPLVSFSAYLGTVMAPAPLWPWAGGLMALCAIFLPSFLLVFGALPFWERIAQEARARAALQGVNAAVVGILLAALYDPVWRSAIRGPVDFALAVAAFGLLAVWKAPPWLVVALSGAAGAALAPR